MKALPSIAFNEFKGSAGDVTARVSKGRQVLSARSMHSSSKTPAQAVSRNRLAKISRSYKKLTDEQMKAWAVLAEKMKGISTFGQAAELTPHNAFVRINSNLQMVACHCSMMLQRTSMTFQRFFMKTFGSLLI